MYCWKKFGHDRSWYEGEKCFFAKQIDHYSSRLVQRDLSPIARLEAVRELAILSQNESNHEALLAAGVVPKLVEILCNESVVDYVKIAAFVIIQNLLQTQFENHLLQQNLYEAGITQELYNEVVKKLTDVA